MDILNLIIIGGGCAGLAAGIYAGRADLQPVLFSGDFEDKGGLLVKTSIVENYPGFPNGVNGFELIDNMEEQAKNCGCKIIDRKIVAVDFSDKVFKVTDSKGGVYQSKAVIIATGSSPRKLGLDNEDKFWSKGLSSCAVCDGALYRNKKIAVVGGGDSALEEATFLTKFSDVILIHRRDSFRASKAMQKKLFDNPKITIMYDTVVSELLGDVKLEKITVTNVKTGKQQTLEVDGLFYGLGLIPNTQLFNGVLEMDNGYILKKPHPRFETMTSVPGIFVAGDSNDHVYKQAIVASGDGCKAALDADSFLSEEQN